MTRQRDGGEAVGVNRCPETHNRLMGEPGVLNGKCGTAFSLHPAPYTGAPLPGPLRRGSDRSAASLPLPVRSEEGLRDGTCREGVRACDRLRASLDPSSDRTVHTLGQGIGPVHGKLSKGVGMPGMPSIAKRSRAHFADLHLLCRRIHEDGIVTPVEEAEYEEKAQEHALFELVGDTSHLLRQAADRATDSERLADVWELHVAAVERLPIVHLPQTPPEAA